MTSQLSNLATIASFIASRAQLAGLDEESVFSVQMAVDEACTNTIEHAYRGGTDGEVRICCYVERDDFVVRITDFGAPFDPSRVPEPDVSGPLEGREIGGLGVFFIRKLMDDVEFVSDPVGGNQVTMRKRRKPGGAG